MNTTTCRLPDDFRQDIEQHAHDVDRTLTGELSASIMKSRRVPRGIYEQRQNGRFMLRVRVPGGAISAAQARTLAEVAARHGGDLLHVTTRQDIQMHGLQLAQTPAVMRELFPAGLTSKGGGGNSVRNVTACPYAGICPAERFDVTPFVQAVTEHLIGLPGSYNLPRKYKIAFSGCRADCALAQVTDLGFIAQVCDGIPGFSVYVGGGMGAESRIGDLLEAWLPADEAVRLAEAVRRLFDRLGDRRNRRRARLRFVVQRVGIEAFRDWVHETRPAVAGDGTPLVAPLPELAAAPAEPRGDYRTLLTPAAGLDVLRQRQAGYMALPLHLPVGDLSATTLVALADLAERYSAEQMLRTTQDQNLLLRFVREADLDALRVELEGVLGLAPAHAPALQAFTTCTGAATCRLGLCLSQPAARASAEALTRAAIAPATLQGVDIRINGCPNACGQHPIGTIGLFGVAQRAGERLVPAYRVLLGARRGEGCTRFGALVGAVPARALPDFLVAVLRDFESGHTPYEPFADYFDRCGLGHFQALLAAHLHVPSHADAPAFYRDWGSDEEFSLAGRGAGECGAGVFEIVGEDLAAAAKALEQAELESESTEPLWRALLATTRALLITRGLDIQDPDGILRAFETHFVETQLVDADARSLLACGEAYRAGQDDALCGRQAEIQRLLDRVQALFASMDADLRFHVAESVSLKC